MKISLDPSVENTQKEVTIVVTCMFPPTKQNELKTKLKRCDAKRIDIKAVTATGAVQMCMLFVQSDFK